MHEGLASLQYSESLIPSYNMTCELCLRVLIVHVDLSPIRNDLLFPNIDATTRYSAVYFASWFVLSVRSLPRMMIGSCERIMGGMMQIRGCSIESQVSVAV